MVDARFPERYLNDRRIARLSTEDFRSYTMAMLWSVSNRTDGSIELGDVDFIPQFKGSAERLVEVGLWEAAADGTGWVIVDFADTQTSADELELLGRARRAEAAKKKRQRAHAKGDHSMCGEECEGAGSGPHFPSVPGDNQGDSPGDVSRVQDRQDRTGRQGQQGWPTAAIPAAAASCWSCGATLDGSGACTDQACPEAKETRWAS